jgi:hypothetical protein
MSLKSFVSKIAFMPPENTPEFILSDNIVLIPYIDENLVMIHKQKLRIPALWYKSESAKYTILFSHGNASDISCYTEHYWRNMSDKLNVNIMIYEYMGYGWTKEINQEFIDDEVEESSISTVPKLFIPSEDKCYRSIESAYDYLINKCNISANTIIPFGHSLGTGPSCELASKRPVGGLILKSALMSAVRVAVDLGFTLPFDIFANIDKVSKVKCPIFLIHGDKDDVIPYLHSEKLSRKIDNLYEFWLVPNAGHNDIDRLYRNEYMKKLFEFISSLDN